MPDSSKAPFKPIDRDAKDGNHILAYGMDGNGKMGFAVVHFHRPKGYPESFGYWVISHTDGTVGSSPFEPISWQPLPESPV